MLYTLQISGLNIQLVWIPSHVGIIGNEVADKLAKQGLQHGKIDEEISTDKTEFRSNIKKLMLQKWQEFYNNDTKGAFYKNLQPQVDYKVKNTFNTWKDEVQLFRLRSGHCYLNEYKSRIFKDVPSDCDICQEPETVSHLLFDCPGYIDQHVDLYTNLYESNIPINLHVLNHPLGQQFVLKFLVAINKHIWII